MPKLPANLKCDFALIDIQTGRNELAKIVETGHRVPFVIVGYLQQGPGPVGGDDGISREFGADVIKFVFGAPEYVSCDKIGRPWAMLADLEVGDKVTFDADFDCLPKGAKRTVRVKLGENRLFVNCGDGAHYLDGQLGEGKDAGALIGVYKLK